MSDQNPGDRRNPPTAVPSSPGPLPLARQWARWRRRRRRPKCASPPSRACSARADRPAGRAAPFGGQVNRSENTLYDCEVDGDMPDDLDGAFYRVGPDPQYPKPKGARVRRRLRRRRPCLDVPHPEQPCGLPQPLGEERALAGAAQGAHVAVWRLSQPVHRRSVACAASSAARRTRRSGITTAASSR